MKRKSRLGMNKSLKHDKNLVRVVRTELMGMPDRMLKQFADVDMKTIKIDPIMSLYKKLAVDEQRRRVSELKRWGYTPKVPNVPIAVLSQQLRAPVEQISGALATYRKREWA